MPLVDSHCHLEKFHQRGELESVLDNAAAAGVDSLIAVGTSLKDWALYRDLSVAHPGRIYWTAGLHPCHVDEEWRDHVTALSTYFTDSCEPVALGEIGLDYFHLPKFPDEAAEIKKWQAEAFEQQLRLAYQFDCPIVIHSRNAFDDCVRMIDASGVDWSRVVFHCFSEGASEMEQLNLRGGRGSFTGIVTYKSADTVRAALKQQGIERLMVETDAPYLAPVPHRGKECEPAMVVRTAEACAEILGLSPEETAVQTTANARAFFGLK